VTEPVRVAFVPHRMGGNPYLHDLAASLPSDRVTEVDASWEAIAGRDASADVDVVHIQLLQMLLDAMGTADPRRRVARYARRLARLRRDRVAIVWTMHNLESHEHTSPALDRLARRMTAAAAARVLVHCEAARAELRRLWPPARSVVIPHPAHDVAPGDRAQARTALGIAAGARVVAIPGRIREYKDVPGAVRALRGTAGPDTVVIVAGEPHTEALGDAVRAAAAGDARIRLVLRLVGDDEIRRIVGAADVVMLPYRRILTSGAAVLAGELAVPCVAPSIGCLAEQLGDGCLTYAPGDLHAAAALATTTAGDELRRRGQAARKRVTVTTWARAGMVHAALYEAVSRHRPTRLA